MDSLDSHRQIAIRYAECRDTLTPEAIERVWSEALRRAVEIRKTMKPPTCAHCGRTDWTVSVTEITGRKLHVACWQAETQEADRKRWIADL